MENAALVREVFHSEIVGEDEDDIRSLGVERGAKGQEQEGLERADHGGI